MPPLVKRIGREPPIVSGQEPPWCRLAAPAFAELDGGWHPRASLDVTADASSVCVMRAVLLALGSGLLGAFVVGAVASMPINGNDWWGVILFAVAGFLVVAVQVYRENR